MKTLQLQKDFLKHMYDIKIKDKNGNFRYEKDEKENCFWITDGFRIYRINEDENFLDYAEFDSMKLDDYFQFYDVNKQINIFDTGLIKNNDREKFKVFSNDKFKIYVNEKFFRYFDGVMKFKAIEEDQPLFCYEVTSEEKLVAILLPIRSDTEEIQKDELRV